MNPQIHLNFLGIFLAVVASFVFGWLWYGPIFGKIWSRLMNFPDDMKPSVQMMIKSMVINLFGTFLTAYVLIHSIQVWRPSVWGIGLDDAAYMYGFMGGFFTWLGFYVPKLLNSVAWEMRSWKLFFLNAAYHFIDLQIIGVILACMH
jgi:hypothetical protein